MASKLPTFSISQAFTSFESDRGSAMERELESEEESER